MRRLIVVHNLRLCVLHFRFEAAGRKLQRSSHRLQASPRQIIVTKKREDSVTNITQTKTLVRTGSSRSVGAWIAMAMFTAMLIGLSRPATAVDDPERVMKTVGGVLQVAGEAGEKRLLLNKKPVTYMDGTNKSELADDIIVLQEKYRLKGNDIVMLYTACSGSSCSYSSVYFVTVTPAGKATVAGSIEAGEGGLAKEEVKVVGDTLAISSTTFISPRKKKTERWTLVDGKLDRSK